MFSRTEKNELNYRKNDSSNQSFTDILKEIDSYLNREKSNRSKALALCNQVISDIGAGKYEEIDPTRALNVITAKANIINIMMKRNITGLENLDSSSKTAPTFNHPI